MLVSNLLKGGGGGGRNDYSVEQSLITAMHENYSNTDIFTGAKDKVLFRTDLVRSETTTFCIEHEAISNNTSISRTKSRW